MYADMISINEAQTWFN